MAVFRILDAKARPGAVDRIATMIVRQASDVVGEAPGILFVQALRSGDQLLAVSSWRTVEDMERYLELDATRAFYRDLPEHLMGVPSVRTYEVLDLDGAGPAAGWPAAGATSTDR